MAADFGDIDGAVVTGAVDGVELVYANIAAAGLNEHLTHANETGHILLVNFQIVSAEWFETLPADIQAVLVEECVRAGRTASLASAEVSAIERANLLDLGMVVVEDVDLDAFRQRGEAAYEALGLTEARDQVYRDLGR